MQSVEKSKFECIGKKEKFEIAESITLSMKYFSGQSYLTAAKEIVLKKEEKKIN